MNNNRDDAIDAIKGVAILIVMLGHCIVLNGLADPYFYDAIAAVQMPLFMAVSGYTTGRFLKPFTGSFGDRAKVFLKVFGRRSVSYLLPFFSWLIVTHLTNPLKELKLQLFATDRGLWFLMTLWIITAFVLIGEWLSPVEKTRGLTVTVSLAALGVLLVFQTRQGSTFLSPSLTLKYLPFYYVFYAAALRMKGRSLSPLQKKGGMVLAALSVVLFIGLIAGFDMVFAGSTFEFLMQELAGLSGAYAVFVLTLFLHGRLHFRPVAVLGCYTLEIYVLHFRFARLLGIGERELVCFSPQATLWVLAAFLVMSMCTFLSIWLLKKFWITDLLFFGKLPPGKGIKEGNKNG